MNPVTIADLEVRWRPLTSEEQTVAQAVLDDAWALLVARAVGLEDRLNSGALSYDLAVAVVSAMALRVLRNPEGYVSETSGPFSYRRSEQTVAAGAGLFVTPDELALLSPTGAAFTVRQTAAPVWSS